MKDNRLYSLDDTLKLTRTDIIDLHNKYLNSSLVKLLSKIDFTRQFVKAQGTQVWDSEGIEYIDKLLIGFEEICANNKSFVKLLVSMSKSLLSMKKKE